MVTLPTLQAIYAGVLTDLETEYGVNISLTQKVALRAIAAVQAGKLWLSYKVLGFLQRQVWADTADSEINGGTLERFGRVRLGRNPRPAVAAQYTVSVTGTAGAIIPAQAVFRSNDTALHPGILYILDTEYTMSGSSDAILLRALTAGDAGSLSIGDTLTSTSPIALVNSTATVTAETVEPLAAETLTAYRAAILQSFRLEAQGGAATDYRIWAADAQGVAAVYPYPKSGETNANNIFVEATIADSTDGKGTPSQAILDEVEAVTNFNPDTTLNINERGRRPNTVVNYFLPITPDTIDIIIDGFTGVTATQQALILQALTDFIATVRPFVVAADAIVDRNDVLSVNNINGVIFSQIPTATYTSATLKVNGVSVSSNMFVQGNIPWLNSVTYT